MATEGERGSRVRLGDICSATCFPNAANFPLPPPGCKAKDLRFESEGGRDYYSVLLRNHDVLGNAPLNPRLAIVGLSPAANQIDEFVASYRKSGSYVDAAIQGAFAGLSGDIIEMMRGLGLLEKFGLRLASGATFARHPDIYVTSLVACATLTTAGSSNDFDPRQFIGTSRCIEQRFVGELLNPNFTQLRHVIILGAKAWSAIADTSAEKVSVLDRLKRAGKEVISLPHPSGANREYVKLASLPLTRMPSLRDYIANAWEEYKDKPPPPSGIKQSEAAYKAKRRAAWNAIYELRWQIAEMEGSSA